MGHQFDQKYLEFHRQPVDGVVLLATVQILKSSGHHFIRLIQTVKELHFAISVGLEGVVKELRFDPTGVHGHDTDALAFQLPVHSAAVAEHKGLGSAVSRDVGHRLECRKAVQLQDMAAGLHIGHTQPGHNQQCLAVQVNHPAVIGNGHLMVSAEFAKAGGIYQQFDIGLLLFQHGSYRLKAALLQQVQ